MTKASKTESQPRPILAMGLFGRSNAAPAKLLDRANHTQAPRGVVKAA